MLAQGNFNFADVRENLEDLGYERSQYRDFETWGERAALIEEEDYVILGFVAGAIEDLLLSLDRGQDQLAFERGTALELLLESVGSGAITRVLADTCLGSPTAGCDGVGASLTYLDSESGAARVRTVFLHEDEESAEDALIDLEDSLLESVDVLEVLDAQTEGNVVILELETGGDTYSNFYDFVEDGPVARGVGSAPAAANVAEAPVRQIARFGDSFDDAGRIDVGDEVRGRISREEQHFFEFNAQGGSTYTIETDADFDTYLELFDDSGDLLDSDDDGGSGSASRLRWSAPSSGNYIVMVRGFGGSDAGSYDLLLTTLDPDDHAGSFDDATPIDPKDQADGSILEDDEDIFVFDARRNNTYIIETEADFDTYLELYNDSGDFIDSDDDGG